jgi:hypothetical protein
MNGRGETTASHADGVEGSDVQRKNVSVSVKTTVLTVPQLRSKSGYIFANGSVI